VFCAKQDYHIIESKNIVFEGDFICLSTKNYSRGFFKLDCVDAVSKGFCWERLIIKGSLPRETLVRTLAYASDFPEAPADGQYSLVGSDNDIIVGLSGRFLWLKFELIAAEQSPVIVSISLQMGGDHMEDYLPAIYRRGGALTRRFLSVFDSLSMDLERAIAHTGRGFDYTKAHGRDLLRLAEWVCVEPGENEKETRSRIRSALHDFETMYTVEGVKRSIKRMTGSEPLIIEYADVDPNSPTCPDSALYRRLYGDNPFKFFILLDESAIKTNEDAQNLSHRMLAYVPAGLDFELVALKHHIQLDGYCYLGINSHIGGFTAATVGESAAIVYDTICTEENDGTQL